MTGTMVYRLRVSDAADPHMTTFTDALSDAMGIWDNRSFNHVAGLHGVPGWYCWHHQRNQRTDVQARLFLPWHRAYLLDLEQKLQDLVDGTSLP
ncbi:MAG: tyrosinase family protein [Pseudomonadota bacterium]